MIICYIPIVEKPIEDSNPSLDLPEFTAKQEAFIEHYCTIRNGAKAARAAGYTGNSVYSTASELLRLPKVSMEIKSRLHQAGWTKNRLIGEISSTYEEILETDSKNWKERREFIALMGRLMGYLSTEGSGQNISIINISGNRLESYNQTYVKKAQVIDAKEVTSFVKRAITGATSDNNEANGDKL